MSIKRILAAVGQVPQDEAVLARALELSAAHEAALCVLHVVELPGKAADLDRPDTLLGQADLAARDKIGAALAGLGAAQDAAELRIETGSPALRLIAACEDAAPDLIVMGPHQNMRLAERILGSTTDRVVAGGGVPVLVVRRAVERPYARAVLATSGNDDAEAALALVRTLLPAAALHLVQAVQITSQLEEAMLRVGTGSDQLDAHRKEMEDAARTHLNALAARAGDGATTEVLGGDPAAMLVRASQSAHVDVMAVGPGNPGLLRRAFIGSVARRLLRDAGCDVLVCRT